MPTGFLSKDVMLDDAACVGIRFENPTDVGTRCAPDPAAEPAPAPPAKCITFSCPDGYVTKESLPEGIFCAGEQM